MNNATSIQMTAGEERAIMDNPHGLRLLMDHADLQYTQAESMLEPGECGPWPTPRFEFLRERGRQIMAEDMELWDDDIKRAFGLDVPND
jgi:hypothetical protein